MMALRIVGIDPSLRSTGVSDGSLHDAFHTDDSEDIDRRLLFLANRCVSFALYGLDSARRADVVVIEGPSFGSKGNAHDQLSGLRFVIRHRLMRLGIPFTVVPPSTLKLYTAGNGRAGKPQMVQALADRHGLDLRDRKVKDGKHDVADAFALAAMGYARYGQPLPAEGPPPPMKAQLSVAWPELS